MIKMDFEKILIFETMLVITIIVACIMISDKHPDPLRNITQEEYKSLYIYCIQNSTCNLYLGPGTVDACIKNCIRMKITNTTNPSIWQTTPHVIGSTATHNIDIFEKIK